VLNIITRLYTFEHVLYYYPKKHIVSLEHRYCNVHQLFINNRVPNIDINNRGPNKRIISLSLGVDLLASLYLIAIRILIVSLSHTVVTKSLNNTEKR